MIGVPNQRRSAPGSVPTVRQSTTDCPPPRRDNQPQNADGRNILATRDCASYSRPGAMAQRCPVGALRLDRASGNFSAERAAFPRFKKKCRHDSFRYPDLKQIKLDQGHGRIFLPKLGWMRLRLSRKVLGELRNATVSLSGLRLCERGQPHDTGEVRLRRLRLRGQRRCRRRDQYFGAGTPRCSLWRGGAAGPSNPPKRLCAESSMRSTVGISAIQAGEDVQCPPFSRLSSDATSAAASSDADRHDGLNAAAQA